MEETRQYFKVHDFFREISIRPNYYEYEERPWIEERPLSPSINKIQTYVVDLKFYLQKERPSLLYDPFNPIYFKIEMNNTIYYIEALTNNIEINRRDMPNDELIMCEISYEGKITKSEEIELSKNKWSISIGVKGPPPKWLCERKQEEKDREIMVQISPELNIFL